MLPVIRRSLLLAVLAASVQGCQHGSMPLDDSLVPKPHVDAGVMQECKTVVDIPHRFIPYDEMLGLWAADRAISGDCRRGKHAAITTIKALIR
jgi:hypothetical protein